jgi:hypothetical protein
VALEIVEHEAVRAVGAVLARQGDRTIIVLDPALSNAEKQALITELTGK